MKTFAKLATAFKQVYHSELEAPEFISEICDHVDHELTENHIEDWDETEEASVRRKSIAFAENKAVLETPVPTEKVITPKPPRKQPSCSTSETIVEACEDEEESGNTSGKNNGAGGSHSEKQNTPLLNVTKTEEPVTREEDPVILEKKLFPRKDQAKPDFENNGNEDTAEQRRTFDNKNQNVSSEAFNENGKETENSGDSSSKSFLDKKVSLDQQVKDNKEKCDGPGETGMVDCNVRIKVEDEVDNDECHTTHCEYKTLVSLIEDHVITPFDQEPLPTPYKETAV
ncbi:predicted protein [Nematostella vectensis]|uniref:Uncharacterized protein n=1 Tax=Nematostella vectensis TaxID=45351 RepID=A7S1Z7_NEMVE|nr:predicted protein [Nematostella vectensis]|eukprot:XP_001634351.1 predicted protein [Nematostella vectensis]